MRNTTLVAALFTLAAALPLHADRGQSYFSANEGPTIVRQQEDAKEIEGRVNLPVFPGDEVITGRRGRSEIRLSDGNVVGLDAATDIRFRSILDAYEGDASQTIVEMRYGHLAVQRTAYGHEYVRVDTDQASYIAAVEAVYSIWTERGRDRVTVFAGGVEVRTPQSTELVHAGEEASVEGHGVYSKGNGSYVTADDFERWFLHRTERSDATSRYLDQNLAYADDQLEANGSWTYVSGYGTWAWRPRVSAGWRPYYNGEWVGGPSGALVWASYEPWGWVPYHYGRWAYDSGYGWVWLPGGGYSPAWVYWMYGPSYVGWAPSGWWDCYRPYYNWCYRPYSHASWDGGHGWSGHVAAGDIDYRPWTFVQNHQLVGVRVDTAAATTDVVRQRMLRDGGATVSTGPARFTHAELRDPALAVGNVIRRGGTGNGATAGGASNDIGAFIRRDPNLNPAVRDRVVRLHPINTPPPAVGSVAPIGTGGLAPIGGGGSSIGGGGIAPIWRGGGSETVRRETQAGSATGIVGAPSSGNADRGTVRRGEAPGGTVDRGSNRSSSGDAGSTTVWRDRVSRPATPAPSPEKSQPATSPQQRQEWRSRGSAPGVVDVPTAGSSTQPSNTNDVPRRVIDRIRDARFGPGTEPPRVRESGSSNSGRSSASSPPPRSSTPAPVAAPPPAPAPRTERPSSSSSSSSSSSDHGHVKRD